MRRRRPKEFQEFARIVCELQGGMKAFRENEADLDRLLFILESTAEVTDRQ